MSSLGRIQRRRSNILMALEPHWACIPSTSQTADFSGCHCFWFKAICSCHGSTTPLQNPTLYSLACNLPRTAAWGSSLDRKQRRGCRFYYAICHSCQFHSVPVGIALDGTKFPLKKFPVRYSHSGPFWLFRSQFQFGPIPVHSREGFILPFKCSKN